MPGPSLSARRRGAIVWFAFALALAAGVTPFPAPVAAAAAQDAPAPPPGHSQGPREVPADEEPQGALPPPPPRGDPRRANAAISAGPGRLTLWDDLGRDGQGAASLAARVGVVMAPEWNLVLGVDHARTDRGGATFSQSALLFGVQRFFFGRLYLGAALGMGFVEESGVPGALADGPGATFSAHLGVETFRLRHAALTVEIAYTIAEYKDEMWEMAGLRLGAVVF